MRLRYWIEGPGRMTADELRVAVERAIGPVRRGLRVYEATPDEEPDTCTQCGAECPEEAHPVIGAWHRSGCKLYEAGPPADDRAWSPARHRAAKPTWDRSACAEKVCTCHDDTAPAYACSACGCRPTP